MYRASVKSILYTVLKCGEREIFGIPNLFADTKIMEYSLIEDDALAELVNNGCADMDFNGKTTILPEFMDIVRLCAKCREVAVIDIRTEERKQKHVTVYFTDNGLITINNIDDEYAGMCAIGVTNRDGIYRWVERNIGVLGNVNRNIREVILESGVVTRCSVKEMQEYGCNREQANLIKTVIEGNGKILISRKIKYDEEIQACSFIFGNNCEMEMQIEYQKNKENIHFFPIERKYVYTKLDRVLELM